MDELSTVLGEIVGPRGMSGSADLPSHAVDGISPRAAVFPHSRQELAEIVAAVSELDLSVAPRGGGTMMDLGQPPDRIDVVVATSRLDSVLEYSPADLTITVEAGMALAKLQKILSAEGQYLPIDPPLPALSTIGGVVATNASGPWRHSSGTMRDLILGVEVVGQGGRIIKSGGRVVKNVTGYDLCKLFVGSLGTLGIIAGVTLKVSPLPRATATLLLPLATLEEAATSIPTFNNPPLEPAALDILDAGCVSHLGLPFLPSAVPVVAIAFAGSEKAIARQLAEVETRYRSLSGSASIRVAGREEAIFWERVRDLPATAAVVVRVGGPPNQLCGNADGLSALAKYGLSTLIRAGGRAAMQLIWQDHLPSDARAILAAIGAAQSLADRLQTGMIVERCPREIKESIAVWGSLPPSFRIMRQIKRRLDPQSTFNPGRFVGGL